MNSKDQKHLLNKYSDLNNSFDKTLTFHLGSNAGFFSEFNNMVFAILYCLKNKIKFKLYSKEGNLSYSRGWQDFFQPFCSETSFFLHKRYNRRSYQMKNAKPWPPEILKIITSNQYLTQDIWDSFRNRHFENATFNIPELGLYNASLLESAKLIIKMIWRYNEAAGAKIRGLKSTIPIPEKYLSIHIRAGDKRKEKQIYEVENYMKIAVQLDISKNIFVLTYDYQIIREMKVNYPDWNFLTLCHPSENGYVHSEFIQLDKREKFYRHLKLMANIDICASSEKFIGTYSSGPGSYLAMRKGEEQCFGIDYNSWVMW